MACAPGTAKQSQPVQSQAREEKKPSAESRPGKQESLGVGGGSGPEQSNNAAEQKREPSAELISLEASNAAVRQFYEGYDKATDRLGYLLSSLDSPYDAVLYAAAVELSAFDDPRSIEALKKLEKHQMREELARTVADGAQQSLDKIEYNRDQTKLTASRTTLGEKRAIIKKYSENMNRVARSNILRYLRDSAVKNPETYAPLIIEYFPYDDLAKRTAEKYPEYADKGLDRCLMSTSGNTVKECMRLVGKLKKSEYLERIYAITYERKGAIDYKNESEILQTRIGFSDVLYYFKEKTMEYSVKLLYSKYDEDISKAIGRIYSYKTDKARNILIKFKEYYKNKPVINKDILAKLDYCIQKLNEERP
jgi:hypothetical protein